jgi:hypothetical protein
MLWTKAEMQAAATRRDRELEFEDQRRRRMQERESRARLFRSSGRVDVSTRRPPARRDA